MKGSGSIRNTAVRALPLLAALLAAPQASAQIVGPNLAPNVNVVNTPNVNVVNQAGAPLPVREVAAAARQPVTINLSVGMSFGTQRFGCADYTVPANKRLEIDHVSAGSVVLYAGNTIKAEYVTHTGSDTNEFNLNFANQNYSTTEPLYVADAVQLSFADPGSVVELCATLKNTQGSGSGGFSALRAVLTGYLINSP